LKFACGKGFKGKSKKGQNIKSKGLEFEKQRRRNAGKKILKDKKHKAQAWKDVFTFAFRFLSFAFFSNRSKQIRRPADCRAD
jgi:hypothetical protein